MRFPCCAPLSQLSPLEYSNDYVRGNSFCALLSVVLLVILYSHFYMYYISIADCCKRSLEHSSMFPSSTRTRASKIAGFVPSSDKSPPKRCLKVPFKLENDIFVFCSARLAFLRHWAPSVTSEAAMRNKEAHCEPRTKDEVHAMPSTTDRPDPARRVHLTTARSYFRSQSASYSPICE